MLVADLGKANPTGFEPSDGLLPILSMVHLHRTVEYNEDFRAIVDMPNVWFIRPMEPDRGVVDRGDFLRAPGVLRSEGGVDELHSVLRSIGGAESRMPRIALHKVQLSLPITVTPPQSFDQ
jgi:hypothetical protein